MAARFTPRVLQQASRGYATQSAVKPPVALHGLAGKYASSAYVAAASKDAKSLEKVEADLKQIKSLLSGTSAEARKVKDFIDNPTLSSKDKSQGIAQLLGGKEGEITKNLFEAMAEHGRLAETERVVDGFLQLMSAHRGEVEVTVTSATALDKSTQQRLEAALKSSQYATKGKSVKFTHKVDPSIQGGLVVDLGDRSVDLSVSSRVNRLNTLLQQGI